jgi:hypothetical protein
MSENLESPCRACRNTLGRLVRRHTAACCPLKASLYCGACAVYGHSRSACPLEPPADLEIPDAPAPEDPKQAYLIVPYDREIVRGALYALEKKPKICQATAQANGTELKENWKTLQAEAKKEGWVVVMPPTKAQIEERLAAAGMKPPRPLKTREEMLLKLKAIGVA